MRERLALAAGQMLVYEHALKVRALEHTIRASSKVKSFRIDANCSDYTLVPIVPFLYRYRIQLAVQQPNREQPRVSNSDWEGS